MPTNLGTGVDLALRHAQREYFLAPQSASRMRRTLLRFASFAEQARDPRAPRMGPRLRWNPGLNGWPADPCRCRRTPPPEPEPLLAAGPDTAWPPLRPCRG